MRDMQDSYAQVGVMRKRLEEMLNVVNADYGQLKEEHEVTLLRCNILEEGFEAAKAKVQGVMACSLEFTADVARELAEREAQHEVLEGKVRGAAGRCAEMAAKVREAEEEVAVMSAEKGELEGRLGASAECGGLVESEMEQLRARTDSLKEELSRVQQEGDATARRLQEEQDKMLQEAVTSVSLREELEKTRQETAELKKALEEASQALLQAQSALDIEVAERKLLEGQLGEVSNVNSALMDTSQAMSMEANRNWQASRELAREKAERGTERAVLEKRILEADGKGKELENALAEASLAVHASKARVHDVKLELTREKAMRDTERGVLEGRLDEAGKEIENLVMKYSGVVEQRDADRASFEASLGEAT